MIFIDLFGSSSKGGKLSSGCVLTDQDFAGHRGSLHMNIEDGQEDGYSVKASLTESYLFETIDLRYDSVGRS